MVLKRLVLKGFKSFPDKTEINFEHGITAIVGPNGSGKSNLVDAIRWVFGEQSAKTLRGGKMDDVIFGGSRGKMAQSYAEVTLVVDNSDRSLATNYDEVAICRRVYRSGEGEYFINKSNVRLKDIVELFMNTGLGKDGYSIISQGRITEIISQKSAERRNIFDEAAGISKYRYRKEESQKKLKATDENLLRVSDIFGELESRVEPLRIQSEKARRYLDLYEEKKNLDINLWLYDLDHIRESAEKLQNVAFLAHTNLEAAERDIVAVESRIEQLFELGQKKNAQMDDLMEQSRQKERESADLRSAAAVLETEIRHREEQAERLRASLAQSEVQAGAMDGEYAAAEADIAHLKEQKSGTDARLLKLAQQAQEAMESMSGLGREIEQLRLSLAENQAKMTDLRIEQTACEAGLSSLCEREEQLQGQIAVRGQEMETQNQQKQALEGKISACERTIASCGNILGGYQKKLDARKNRAAEREEVLRKAVTEQEDKRRRLDTLREMEKQMDGYSGSVKKVMQEAGRGRLRNVHGPISKLIQTEDAYVAAIETALGYAVQNIVVDSEADAKGAIALLKREGAGRATFMPITAIRGGTLAEKNLSRFEGFINLASNLIKVDGKYQNIVESLLGRTVVAKDLDGATEIARGCGYKFRIVTLDGQVVNAGGSFTGGSLAKSAGFLSRAATMQRLEQEIAAIQENAKTLEEAFRESQKELASIESAMAVEMGRKEEKERERLSYGQELSGVAIQIRSLSEENDRDAGLAKDIQEQAGQMRARQESGAAQLSKVDEARQEIDREMERLTGSHQAEQEKNQELLEQVSSIRIEAAELEKDLAGAQMLVVQIEERRRIFRLEKAGRKEEIESELAQAKTLEGERDENSRRQEERTKQAQQMQEQLKAMGQERDKADQDAAKLRQSLREKNAHKEQLIKEYERLSNKQEAFQTDHDSLISKLYDEYELTHSEAKSKKDEAFDHDQFQKRSNQVRRELKEIGSVNVDAIEEYKLVKERYEFYLTQLADLAKAKEDIQQFITEITEQMRIIFTENFAVINQKFQEVFTELFGGGNACLELTDPEDVLESGVEIKAAPPGKIIKNLSMLSGGEQAFVAIALYFGIMRVRPVPFCVLDEIEAALDEVNVARFARFLQDDKSNTQFVVITHRRGTMEVADMLYGVTMQEHGVSRVLALNVNEVEKKLKIKI